MSYKKYLTEKIEILNENERQPIGKLQFDIRSDLTVVDTNPEMADMGNPRGEIIRPVYYIIATDEEGNTWTWDVKKSQNEADLESQLQKMEQKGTINLNYWTPSRPRYGSKAYEQYGARDDMEWEREQEREQGW